MADKNNSKYSNPNSYKVGGTADFEAAQQMHKEYDNKNTPHLGVDNESAFNNVEALLANAGESPKAKENPTSALTKAKIKVLLGTFTGKNF